jgi:hypothetical protein
MEESAERERRMRSGGRVGMFIFRFSVFRFFVFVVGVGVRDGVGGDGGAGAGIVSLSASSLSMLSLTPPNPRWLSRGFVALRRAVAYRRLVLSRVSYRAVSCRIVILGSVPNIPEIQRRSTPKNVKCAGL